MYQKIADIVKFEKEFLQMHNTFGKDNTKKDYKLLTGDYIHHYMVTLFYDHIKLEAMNEIYKEYVTGEIKQHDDSIYQNYKENLVTAFIEDNNKFIGGKRT